MTKRIQKFPKRSRSQEAFLGFFRLSLGKPQTFSAGARHIKNEKGSALVMAAIFMLVATTLVTVGVKMVSDTSNQGKQRELYVGEAENVARAGIVDALGWFSRQSANGGVVFGNTQDSFVPGQTVTVNSSFSNADQAFNPQNNTANAQLSDTINASIGIVNEYPLDNAVTSLALYWGHYEVVRENNLDNIPNAVQDITGERDTAHVNGDGYVWRIISNGYVYRRLDQTVSSVTGTWNVAYNKLPNYVVANATYSTEFRKLSLLIPQPTPGVNEQGAVFVQNVKNQVTLSSTETLLNGSVSTYGNYAAIGMTSP